MPARSTPEKFWSRVCKRSDGECWEWLGARNGEGYGKLKYHQKDWQSHRLALELTRGPLPEGICVLHSCDNPICCNPYHLTSGTNQDNIDDRMAKGRTVIRGTVLSIAQVQEIRELLLAETSQTAIARLYGVTRQAINKIALGQNWKSK